MSTFFAAQNARNVEKITLPSLGPMKDHRAPAQSPRTCQCAMRAYVPPETVLPRGAGEQNINATAQIRLPPVSELIAEVEARIAGQLQQGVHISRPLNSVSTPLPRVVIECQSLVSRNFPGFPLHEMRNSTTIRPALSLLQGITESEVEKRLTSVQLLIGFYLAGYNHINLAMSLNKRQNCRTVSELVFHVSAVCEKIIVGHCNNYRGPEGIRVGPGYAPFECVRMIRVVQVTENYWVGVLSVLHVMAHGGNRPLV